MSVFDRIKHAIFGDNGPLGLSKGAPAVHPPTTVAEPFSQEVPAIPMSQTPQAQQPASQSPAPVAPVDVEAILAQKAAAYGKPNNWRTSIVDLLTLLGLDSSLAARKELANDLNVHAGADGSADQNIALHKAVMRALVENGGKVPAELTN